MATPDFLGAMNETEPYASKPTAWKLGVVNTLADAFGYQSISTNEQGEAIDNPVSKIEHCNLAIFTQLKLWYNAYKKNEAIKNLTITQFDD